MGKSVTAMIVATSQVLNNVLPSFQGSHSPEETRATIWPLGQAKMTDIKRSTRLTQEFPRASEDPATSVQQDALKTPLRRVASPPRIQLTELFRPDDGRKIRLARQAGIRYAIVDVHPSLRNAPANFYVNVLLKIKDDFQSAGLTLAGVESHPVPAEKIKLGLPGRDEEIDHYIAANLVASHRQLLATRNFDLRRG